MHSGQLNDLQAVEALVKQIQSLNKRIIDLPYISKKSYMGIAKALFSLTWLACDQGGFKLEDVLIQLKSGDAK